MMAGLTSRGVTVDVVSTNDDGDGCSDAPLGVPLAVNGGSAYFFQRDTHFYTISRSLLAWLWANAGNYDLIHAHALFTFPTLAAAMAARHHGKPYILRPVGTLNNWGFANRRPILKQLSYLLCEKALLRHAAAVHVTSVQERREVTARFRKELKAPIIPDFISQKTIVIPEPTDLSEVPAETQTKSPAKTAKTILFLSRIDKKKGIDLLLVAFATTLTKHPNTVLVIAGSGDPAYTASLRKQATDLGIASAVSWPGFVSGIDKANLFRASDIFVLPSYSENFAVAVLEAMSFGLPVVVSENVGLAEDISSLSAAIIVKSDPESIEAGLDRLLSDPDFAAKLGQRGRSVAHAQFSENSCMSSLIGLYEQVTTQSKPRGEATANC
jgi:glycosyltransferase involved in cell wall biosynthesis